MFSRNKKLFQLVIILSFFGIIGYFRYNDLGSGYLAYAKVYKITSKQVYFNYIHKAVTESGNFSVGHPSCELKVGQFLVVKVGKSGRTTSYESCLCPKFQSSINIHSKVDTKLLTGECTDGS